MAVRMDDDRAAGTTPSQGKLFTPWTVLAVVVALILGGALIAALLPRGGGAAGLQTPAPTPGSPTQGGTTSAPPTSVSTQAKWPTEPQLEEVAPGLHKCETTTSGLNTSASFGIGTGWPATQQGGIAAGMAFLTHRLGHTLLDQRANKVVTPKITSDDNKLRSNLLSSGPTVARQLGLNSNGELLDKKTGKPSSGETLYRAAYPVYGAYRLLSYTTLKSGQPDDLVVAVWLPMISGPGRDEDVSKVKAVWVHATLVMTWQENDWKTTVARINPDSPQPADPSHVNQTYAARAATLGPGWCVPADAVEIKLPGVVLAR